MEEFKTRIESLEKKVTELEKEVLALKLKKVEKIDVDELLEKINVYGNKEE